jgi:hypothetical protein
MYIYVYGLERDVYMYKQATCISARKNVQGAVVEQLPSIQDMNGIV